MTIKELITYLNSLLETSSITEESLVQMSDSEYGDDDVTEVVVKDNRIIFRN